MRTKVIIGILRKANEWRRGGEGEMPHPKQYGEAIDCAIIRLQEQNQLIESMTQTKNALVKKLNQSDEALDKACHELEQSNKLVGAGVGELSFANMRIELFKQILDEIHSITTDNLVKIAIENHKERDKLDKLIHARNLFNK